MASHDSDAFPVEHQVTSGQIDPSPRVVQRDRMPVERPTTDAHLDRRHAGPQHVRMARTDSTNEPTGALDLERALTTDETGVFLGHSPVTLQQWRSRGEGPRFFKLGRSIRYRLGDVLAFRDQHMVGKAP
jgi:predicted DNA-binding transcriptional regulator AlpA